MDPPRGVGVELAFGRPEVRAVSEARTPESPFGSSQSTRPGIETQW